MKTIIFQDSRGLTLFKGAEGPILYSLRIIELIDFPEGGGS